MVYQLILACVLVFNGFAFLFDDHPGPLGGYKEINGFLDIVLKHRQLGGSPDVIKKSSEQLRMSLDQAYKLMKRMGDIPGLGWYFSWGSFIISHIYFGNQINWGLLFFIVNIA